MASGQGQTAETIEKTKQQIRGLVGEIAQLSKSDMEPEEFYAAFLQRVVQALAAVGGAVWVLGEGKKPQLAYQINISPKLLDTESDEAEQALPPARLHHRQQARASSCRRSRARATSGWAATPRGSCSSSIRWATTTRSRG